MQPDQEGGKAALLEQWQHRLDSDFPEGLLAVWDEDHGDESDWPEENPYIAPRVEVIVIRGLDPYVLLPLPWWDKTIEGTLVSYDTVQEVPVLVKKAKLYGHPKDMLWSSGVGTSLAGRLAPLRANLIEQAQQRGRSSFADAVGSLEDA